MWRREGWAGEAFHFFALTLVGKICIIEQYNQEGYFVIRKVLVALYSWVRSFSYSSSSCFPVLVTTSDYLSPPIIPPSFAFSLSTIFPNFTPSFRAILSVHSNSFSVVLLCLAIYLTRSIFPWLISHRGFLQREWKQTSTAASTNLVHKAATFTLTFLLLPVLLISSIFSAICTIFH